jgi:SAM-dependent methyltransferase
VTQPMTADSALPKPRWTALSADPMDPAVIAERTRVIDRARRPPVPERLPYLLDLARNQRVLDVGVVDHNLQNDRDWLHGAICGVASYCLGVDIIEDDVARLRDEGYNVECMDVTSGQLPDDTFELIVAGEVIEHVGNPGGLFEAAAKLLTPGGRLVLTTPNPFALWRVNQFLTGKPRENVDHVTLIAPWGMAEFADRVGLTLESFRGISGATGFKAKAAEALVQRRLLPMKSESVCNSIAYEFTR